MHVSHHCVSMSRTALSFAEPAAVKMMYPAEHACSWSAGFFSADSEAKKCKKLKNSVDKQDRICYYPINPIGIIGKRRKRHGSVEKKNAEKCDAL